MARIKRFRKKARMTNNTGLFHNSRQDVKTLGVAFNALVDKVDEIIDELNDREENVRHGSHPCQRCEDNVAIMRDKTAEHGEELWICLDCHDYKYGRR